MNQFNSLIIAILSTCFLLPITDAATSQQVANQPTSLLASTLSAEKIRQLAQAVTIKVLSNHKGGSGVLINKQGTTYTVLTNAHVISNKESHRIQTPDGKIYTATVISQGDSLKGNDLAVLQFQSQENYQIVALAITSEVSENQSVFTAGFPEDRMLMAIKHGVFFILGICQIIKQHWQIIIKRLSLNLMMLMAIDYGIMFIFS
ncbi:S1 family peptidase [Nostoc favosum]|uniref:Serine protease n=1 Tax=Nostoc favosum CHAB5714 TaxID=2780399 RepID=A0ABS8I623_9NOSO|nr:serine protease [Nostoc favosum]MCC5598987.1 serine protease [Nostoc favosum CHAB5714]